MKFSRAIFGTEITKQKSLLLNRKLKQKNNLQTEISETEKMVSAL
jgi:hypothetical protein